MHGIGIFAVRESGGHFDFGFLIAEIDQSHTFSVAVYLCDIGLGIDTYIFTVRSHYMAEFVYGHNLRAEEFVVAAVADTVGAPVVLAGASFRTAEEEWPATFACGEESPGGTYLVIGQTG